MKPHVQIHNILPKNQRPIIKIAHLVLPWFHQYGRHHLPWQHRPSAYRVWVSEIMLQQTQVRTVIPYYQLFMRQFPSLKKLAAASVDEVLRLWSGLGYYARAHRLHQTAQIISQHHAGRFPKSLELLCALPGIGRSTAGAILSFAMHTHGVILDGNVKRVLTRCFGVSIESKQALKELWELAEHLTPKEQFKEYNQAMMDIGATICTRSAPKCQYCPVQVSCQTYIQGLPEKINARSKPVKRITQKIYILVLINAQKQVFLEKRPPLGIWAGLWSFPESKTKKNIAVRLRQLFDINQYHEETYPPFLHHFSHFSLYIHPVVIKIDQKTSTVMDSSDRIWYSPGCILPGGIPKPVSKILSNFYKPS